APVAGPEGLARTGIGRQIARIVGYIGGVSELPEGPYGDHAEEADGREAAPGEISLRQRVDEQHAHEAQQHGAAGDEGHQPRADMDQVMPKDRRRQTNEADRPDAPR